MEVVKGLGFGLDEAVMRAIRSSPRCKFTPALGSDGKAAALEKRVARHTWRRTIARFCAACILAPMQTTRLRSILFGALLLTFSPALAKAPSVAPDTVSTRAYQAMEGHARKLGDELGMPVERRDILAQEPGFRAEGMGPGGLSRRG